MRKRRNLERVPRERAGAFLVATMLALCALVLGGCSAPYRTARIESRARDSESGTVYFVEIRRGRDVPGRLGDELSTEDEVTTVIVCNDRTPELCVRVLPDTLRTVDETRAWAQRLNVTLDAQASE
ncbi:hypothetical protein [Sandaracinus amylolyticus]|uniref:hypothetical protein n=1 Tax=Sandaracinus amylolyticus TaxID=927083 RepID=UPI001F46A69F|nr:hypothetical protein [Sandaracinus amylolyticus]